MGCELFTDSALNRFVEVSGHGCGLITILRDVGKFRFLTVTWW